MKYYKRLIFRYFLALIIMIFGLEIIHSLVSPVTFKLSYLSLFYLSPILTSSTSFLIENYNLNFIPACTAASAYLLLILLTLTTDIKLKKTLKVLLIGSLLILIANIIRIDILIIALIKFNSNLFDTLHLFFWRILSTLYVVILWVLLTKWFKIKEIPIYSDLKKVLKLQKDSKR